MGRFLNSKEQYLTIHGDGGGCQHLWISRHGANRMVVGSRDGCSTKGWGANSGWIDQNLSHAVGLGP